MVRVDVVWPVCILVHLFESVKSIVIVDSGISKIFRLVENLEDLHSSGIC